MNQQRLITTIIILLSVFYLCFSSQLPAVQGEVIAGNSSCQSISDNLFLSRASLSPPVQLPPALFNRFQDIMRTYSAYQPEFNGVVCLLKYYKFFSFLSLPTFEDLWQTINLNFFNSTTTESSSRTFSQFPSINPLNRETNATSIPATAVQITLWHCAKVYLFSFIVRLLEISYILQ